MSHKGAPMPVVWHEHLLPYTDFAVVSGDVDWRKAKDALIR